MNDGLKQRIAGALVLGALGLIFLPVIFDFANPRVIDRTTQLPEAPGIEAIDIATASAPQEMSSAPPAQLFGGNLDQQPADQTGEGGLKENGLPSGWLLRLGSFEKQSKVDKLVASLRSNGHQPFVRSALRQGKQLQLVYVGPFTDRKKALQLKGELESMYEIGTAMLEKH